MDISKLMKAFIAVTEHMGSSKSRSHKIDVSNISYIEALYNDNDELKKKRESKNNLSKIYINTYNGLSTVVAQQTPEEIEALIEAAEDKRIERLNKFRIGIR
ncbi:MAG: hypothetical protein VX740_06565 [Pseudomonadota bacterium]|nr:hypothetical protein [Pseudomonadota bacterium]MED5423085.1 hypothetical protein [Pseudomonadota bacterium]